MTQPSTHRPLARRRLAPASIYLLASGLYLLTTGLVGFAVDMSFPTSAAQVSESHGHVFGVFETNGWHNLAAVLIALPSLGVLVFRPALDRLVAAVIGAGSLAVFIGFELFDPAEVWIASNTADQVVHFLCGAGGLVAARLPSGR